MPVTLESLIPTACPSCKGPVSRNEVDLLCSSPTCDAKLVNLLVSASGRKNLDIDGMGSSVAIMLVEHGVNSLADIFSLPDATTMSAWEMSPGIRFGESRAKTFLAQLEQAKSRPWSQVLHALGCPGLGEPECRSISQRYGLAELLAMTNGDPSDRPLVQELVAIKGMGRKTADVFHDWLVRNSDWLHQLIAAGVNVARADAPEPISTTLAEKTFVITGTHSVPRAVLEQLITEHGGTLSGSVSKKTHYLVAGADAGSKLEKAEAVIAKGGTELKIIDEAGLRELIEQSS